MFIEKKCDICKGSGRMDTVTALVITCYGCNGSGLIIEEIEQKDMRYDEFMEKVGNLLYWYSINGYISDEAGELIYDDIHAMVEDKGIIDIEDYHKAKEIMDSDRDINKEEYFEDEDAMRE